MVENLGKSKGKGEATKKEKQSADLPEEECEEWSFPDDKGRLIQTINMVLNDM